MAKKKPNASYSVASAGDKFILKENVSGMYLNRNCHLIPFPDGLTLTCDTREEAGTIMRILNKNSMVPLVNLTRHLFEKMDALKANGSRNETQEDYLRIYENLLGIIDGTYGN